MAIGKQDKKHVSVKLNKICFESVVSEVQTISSKIKFEKDQRESKKQGEKQEAQKKKRPTKNFNWKTMQLAPKIQYEKKTVQTISLLNPAFSTRHRRYKSWRLRLKK